MKQILEIVMMIGGLMAGCVSMNPYALPTPQPQWEEWGMTRVRETIRRTQLPNSYKEQIDEQVVAQLKDPDSRKIAYLANPYGSLICGTINAKNSYGGYVGAQPFHAYFTPDGHIGNLSIFTPKDSERLYMGIALGGQLTSSQLRDLRLLQDYGFERS